MIHWSELAGTDPRDVLLVGNGPSRKDSEAVAMQQAWPGCVIACNSYWLDGPRDPDYLVCFDRGQVESVAAREPPFRVVAPPATWPTVGWSKGAASRLRDLAIVTGANVVGTALHMAADPAWIPGEFALGNFAGHLAFQLAWILGSKRVHLLGIDCAGRLSSDGSIRLSAFDPAVPGYAGASAPSSECVRLPDGSWRPSGWGFSVELWRALIAAAARAGVRTGRARPGGALDFVEVEAPGSDH